VSPAEGANRAAVCRCLVCLRHARHAVEDGGVPRRGGGVSLDAVRRQGFGARGRQLMLPRLPPPYTFLSRNYYTSSSLKYPVSAFAVSVLYTSSSTLPAILPNSCLSFCLSAPQNLSDCRASGFHTAVTLCAIRVVRTHLCNRAKTTENPMVQAKSGFLPNTEIM
jgi:hypothetical protein